MIRILITGGASGLGEAITKRLALMPDSEIYFTYNTSEVNAKKIKSNFRNTFPVKCDFRNENDLTNLCNVIAETNPDVLINNAYQGSFIATHFHKTNPNNFLEDFKVNVLPIIKITQAAIESFRKRKSGKLITVLSAALDGLPPVGTSVYVAGKAYLEELTKLWAVENSKFGITSNAVSPGFMLTSLTASIDERIVEQIKESNVLKRLLQPEEVAETIYFLCMSGNEKNGENFIVNAGTTF